jgi:hypothetical protein
MRRIVAFCWLCSCACETPRVPTETIVVVDADSVVQGLTKRVQARVVSPDGKPQFDRTFAPDWPVRLAVLPLGGDAKHEFRASVQAIREDGTAVVSASVRTGFIPDSKRYVQLRLTAACVDRDPECDQDSTCRAGECVSAHVPRDALCESSACGESAANSTSSAAGSKSSAAGSESHAPAGCGQNELLCAGECVAGDSLEHCGACDHDCSALLNLRAPARCEADHCVFDADACVPGHGDCNADPEDGCETELSDAEHCGACDVACAPDTQLCAARADGHACVSNCPADKPVLCDRTCVDTRTSDQHCGKCGAACQPGMRCDAGECKSRCEPSQLWCADKCVDPMRDDRHCGGCGVDCGKDHVCHEGACVACAQGALCEIGKCHLGVTQCADGPMCEEQGPVSDGTVCGDGASCSGGFCTCGMSNGSTNLFDPCAVDTDCGPGAVCVDRKGNGKFFCKPLCNADADCAPYLVGAPQLRCAAASCSNGKRPGVGVCDEEDSVLAPAYDSSGCCRGGGGAGNASVSGCADDTREAFTDVAQFPGIAGCEAKWPLASLRAYPTGKSCGNSLGVECTVPADACGVGWHVCAAPPYGPTDISKQVTAEQCAAQPGKYAAAVGDRACDTCNEQAYGAVCCGTACIQGNASCVFPQATAWFGSVDNRLGMCGGLVASHANQGVLCCRGF